MDDRPIGVFDSGIGGLTAVKELIRLLPHEDIIYFGDTGRVPYGTRGNETILKYARQDTDFLLSQNVKLVTAACGTASSVLPGSFAEECGVPFTGVIVPAAQAACATTRTGVIGVIGTPATIKNRAYGKAIRNIDPSVTVIGNPCPLFVPLVENGYTEKDNPVIRMVAEEYLAPFAGTGMDTLILGCTHYPLLKGVIREILGDEVTLVDPGAETARYVANLLTGRRLLSSRHTPGTLRFYVSDSTENFSENAGRFLQRNITEAVERIELG